MSAAFDPVKARRIPDAELQALLGAEPLLLGYQTKLLATTAVNQVVVCQKSRRIGFTWAIACDAVMTAAARKDSGGMDVFYLAYEKEMTREFIDTAAAWADLLHDVAGVHSGVEEFVYEIDKDKSVLAFRIRFASGFEIVALSSSPRGLRGRQGYVIIDEAAFHDDFEEVLKAALALLIWGGKVLVISTHNGVDNPYNKLIEEIKGERKPYALISVDFDEAIADGLYRRICLVRGIEWTAEGEAAWRDDIVKQYGDGADEELFCKPSIGAGSFIPPELISKAVHPEAGKPELYRNGPVYVGNDIARRKDRWVADAVEEVGDVAWLREEAILANARFSLQDEELDRLVLHSPYRVVRVTMDKTGMGEKPVEDAEDRYGAERVDGVLMSGSRPYDIAAAAKRMFEDMRVRIPDDPGLKADLRKVKKVVGPTGRISLKADRDEDGHADRAWALFLALASMDTAAERYEFQAGDARTSGQGFQMAALSGGFAEGALGEIDVADDMDFRGF